MWFLKRYSVVLMPAGLILFGVVLLVVTVLTSRSTRAEMRQSLSAGKQLASFWGKAVSKDQWIRERQCQQEYSKDAKAVKDAAKASCQRDLLSYKIFPKPQGSSQQIFERFGENYRRAVEGLVRKINGGESLSETQVKGLTAESSSAATWDGTGRLMSRRRLGQGVGTGRSSAKKQGADEQIWDKVCEVRAMEICVYADASSFNGYDFWRDYEFVGAEAALEECWKWQVGFWIQQDIADTIAAVNVGSGSVFTSPVKRLLRISFRDSGRDQTTSGRGKNEPPQYVKTSADGLVKPCTGRVCDDDIDVVHFSFTVVLDSKAVTAFLEELCRGKRHKFSGYSGSEPEVECEHNQITILDFDMRPVEMAEDYKAGYRYGEGCVVKLNLVCEYVFDRGGYDPIKPEAIKKLLGQLEEKKPAAADSKKPLSTKREGPARSKTDARVRTEPNIKDFQ